MERREIFGCPCAFVNGDMFTGIHEDSVAVRLLEKDRAERAGIAMVFKTLPGRKMRQYLRAPDNIKSNPASPETWIADGLAYATIRPKQRRKKKEG